MTTFISCVLSVRAASLGTESQLPQLCILVVLALERRMKRKKTSNELEMDIEAERWSVPS